MKTKYFLTAMLLPAAFAACTNEDVLVENPNVLENRPVVDFKVAATYGADDAESRMVNNNGTFLWEGTDELGAAWNLDGSNAVYSNNKFVNTLTEASATVDFTTQSTTVVGQYLFYYPYSTKMTSDLTGVRYSWPEVQEYDPNGDAMMNNNFMISPNVKVDGNEPGELTLPITMRSIYGYGVLNLKLADNAMAGTSSVNSANIQKIIITYNSTIEKDGIINVKNLPLADLSTDHLTALSEGSDNFDQDALLSGDEEESLVGATIAEVRAAILDKADKLITGRVENDVVWQKTTAQVTAARATLPANTTLQSVAISCISEENPNGINLAKGGQFSTRVLLPAAEAQAIKVDVYTDRGVVTGLTTYSMSVLPGHKTVLGQSATNDALTMQTFTSTKTIAVVSEQDFIASMAQYQNIGKDEVTVSINGKFSMTPEAVAAIPENITIEFDTDVTFEGDMTLKNIKMSSGKYAVLKSGDINLSEGIEADKIYITGANAVLTSNDVTLKIVSVQAGELEVSTVDDESKYVELTLKENGGLMAEHDADGNAGKIVVNSPVDGTVTAMSKGTEVIINNEVTTLSVDGEAKAINNGTIKKLYNNGVLNNSGIIESNIDKESDSELNENNGVINQLEGGVILGLKNNGIVNTVADSEITAENLGEIVYVAGARVAATNVDKGVVTYEAPSTFAAGDFSKLNDCVTKVLFNDNFTMAVGDDSYAMTGKNNVKELEFKGNLTVTGNGTWELNTGSKISFTGAKSTVTGGKMTNVATVNVGVAEDEATEAIEEVATNVTIVKGTSISSVTAVTFNSSKAQVWNEGDVYYSGAAAPAITVGSWKANPMKASN